MLQTFYILVMAHFVADFILQGPVIAAKKRGLNKYMLIHGAVMAVAFFLPLINYPAGKTLLGALAVFVLHMTQDAIRVKVNGLLKVQPVSWPFYISLGIDQILHISVIYFLFSYFVI